MDGVLVGGGDSVVRGGHLKPPRHLRAVAPAERPLGPLTLAEKRAAVERDFRANPWMRGEGAQYFTPDRLARLSAENEARRKAKRK